MIKQVGFLVNPEQSEFLSKGVKEMMLTLNIFCNCRSNQHSSPESTRAGWSEEASEVWHKKTKETATTAATRTRSGRNSAG